MTTRLFRKTIKVRGPMVIDGTGRMHLGYQVSWTAPKCVGADSIDTTVSIQLEDIGDGNIVCHAMFIRPVRKGEMT